MSRLSSNSSECLVVGALLRNNDLIEDILNEISSNDFQDQSIAKIFNACLDILAGNEKCSVESFARHHGRLGLTRLVQRLAKFTPPSVTREDVLKNCVMIRESHQRRRLKQTLKEMSDAIANQHTPVTTLLDDFLIKVISISENSNKALFTETSLKDGTVRLQLNSFSGYSELISAITRAFSILNITQNQIVILLKTDTLAIRSIDKEVK